MYFILFVIQSKLCGSNSIIHLLIQFIMHKWPNWREKKVRGECIYVFIEFFERGRVTMKKGEMDWN